MSEPATDKKRKPYLPPALTIYGTVQQLTQKNMTTGSPDGKISGPNIFRTALH